MLTTIEIKKAFVFAQLGDVTNTGEEGAEFDTLNTLIFNE